MKDVKNARFTKKKDPFFTFFSEISSINWKKNTYEKNRNALILINEFLKCNGCMQWVLSNAMRFSCVKNLDLDDDTHKLDWHKNYTILNYLFGLHFFCWSTKLFTINFSSKECSFIQKWLKSKFDWLKHVRYRPIFSVCNFDLFGFNQDNLLLRK